jgi:hypothetical protein
MSEAKRRRRIVPTIVDEFAHHRSVPGNIRRPARVFPIKIKAAADASFVCRCDGEGCLVCTLYNGRVTRSSCPQALSRSWIGQKGGGLAFLYEVKHGRKPALPIGEFLDPLAMKALRTVLDYSMASINVKMHQLHPSTAIYGNCLRIINTSLKETNGEMMYVNEYTLVGRCRSTGWQHGLWAVAGTHPFLGIGFDFLSVDHEAVAVLLRHHGIIFNQYDATTDPQFPKDMSYILFNPDYKEKQPKASPAATHNKEEAE